MATPDGWQVELVRFGPDPQFRVTCDRPSQDGPGVAGVVVTLDELVSLLGTSFELLDAGLAAV